VSFSGTMLWPDIFNTLQLKLHSSALHAVVASLAFLAFKMLLSLIEWCRVHYLLKTNLPRGPPVTNILLGNLLEATRKDFHRTHTEYADKYGGIVPYRALWIHVRSP
jgi:hypothetical protein